MTKRCSCGQAAKLRRSKRRGWIERHILKTLKINPYRCTGCYKRCFRFR